MDFLGKFLNFLLGSGNICQLCGIPISRGHICAECRERISLNEGFEACSVCGRYRINKRGSTGSGWICSECFKSRPRFVMARSAGPYRGSLQEAVYKFKYGGLRALSSVFGQMMAEVFLREPYFFDTQLLVPVPLSIEKLKNRGFNQAELLATKMGKILGLPVGNCLIRVSDIPSQSKLSRTGRRENVKGAFRAISASHAAKVLLIDDILTTGYTAGECAKVLLEAGFKEVGVITLASGIRDK